MNTSEQDRIYKLNRQLTKAGYSLQGIPNKDYQGIAIHSDSSIVYANPYVCEMFGYSEDEMPGLNAWLLFSPESGPILMEHIAQRSEEPYQVLARHKNGEVFPVTLKGHNFMLEGEELRAVLIRQDKHS